MPVIIPPPAPRTKHQGRIAGGAESPLFFDLQGQEVFRCERLEEGEDGDFGFAQVNVFFGGEVADELFDGFLAIGCVPDEGAEFVEVEGFFGAGALQRRGEAKGAGAQAF